MGAQTIARSWLVTSDGLLRRCTEPGCTTLTLGGRCVVHDTRVVREMPRGVPHLQPVPESMRDAWTPVTDPRLSRA